MRLFRLWAALLIATFFIAACAHKQGATSINDTENQAKTEIWAGRISLQVQSEPVQAFFAGFELKGQADSGELTLSAEHDQMAWVPLPEMRRWNLPEQICAFMLDYTQRKGAHP